MFIGEYRYTIDTKKRLAIPAKFRKELRKKVIITRGLDNCLVIYPLKEWGIMSEKLSKLPASQLEARGFARIMLAGAVDVELDKLGRILIPDYLKKYALLKKNVVLLGLSNRIEIWDEKKWQKYKEKTEKEIGDMASRLQQLGI
ncbi:division/cell wall cluster transcriptional repressor MraZ [Patescibacteria group bacterium]|nr:division/cell wall cluster transcriptional repressor MraZ [Patescibacteria group bacterium]